MNLCIPYFVMEPMIDKLSSQHWFASTGKKNLEGIRDVLAKRLHEVSVPLALELGHSALTLGDILQLQLNDVIRLDGKVSDPLGLRVGNRIKFLCEAGLSEKHYAGKVLEVIQEEGLARQEED